MAARKKKRSSSRNRSVTQPIGNESELERECIRIAWDEYAYMNLKQLSAKGIPDRLFFRDGLAFFVEFKDRGKRPGKYQQYIHAQLEKAGMDVYVVDSVDQFREIMEGGIRARQTG